MKNILINNVPSTQRGNYGYKSINKSHSHNENQDNIMNDILDLYNKANDIERTLKQNESYIKTENSYLSDLNKKLLNKFELLYQQYIELSNDSEDRKIFIYPSDCYVNDRKYGAVIDDKTDTITKRPRNKISKFVTRDDITNKVYIPNSLQIAITNENEEEIISSNDNDIYSPFDNSNLYWTRRAVADNTLEKIRTNYIITLPDEIMTTALINELYINPFMCKIIKVYYRYGNSSSWEEVPGQEYHPSIQYSEDSSIESDINSIRPVKLNFTSIKANQIKIVLESSIYSEGETNLRTFFYGIKEIAGYINYYNDYETSYFTADVEIPDDNDYEITGMSVLFNNDTNEGKFYKDIEYEFYYKDEDDEYHKIADVFPFTLPKNNLRIKCIFGGNYNDISIKKLILQYKKYIKL